MVLSNPDHLLVIHIASNGQYRVFDTVLPPKALTAISICRNIGVPDAHIGCQLVE